MWWRSCVAALLAGLPSSAELLAMTVRFAPSECVSCTRSLPERMRRIRGVTEARMVEGPPQRLELEFAAGNRIRVGRVRETLEQDGARWTSALIIARGVCQRDAEGWTIRLFDGDAGTPLEGRTQAGACQVRGSLGADGVLRLD